MWGFWTTFVIIGQALFLVYSDDGGASVTETKQENCSDPNAELRYDNPSCVVTCKRKGLDEVPEFCHGHAELIEDCYCKRGYYLEESTKKCLQQQECPCNATANEVSKFSNDCANHCSTFHTLTPCPGSLFSGCWCSDTYCKNKNNTCVPKE